MRRQGRGHSRGEETRFPVAACGGGSFHVASGYLLQEFLFLRSRQKAEEAEHGKQRESVGYRPPDGLQQGSRRKSSPGNSLGDEWSVKYTGLTGTDANFSGIRFIHLRLLWQNPF